jgi:hypothetical protein
MRQLDDIVVTFVPEAWSATRLVRMIGRTDGLVAGIVIVGWCGTRELRLLQGRGGGRLTSVVDLVVSAQRPADGRGACDHPLTLTDVPDGHRLFDELAAGREVVVAELAPAGPAAVHRWLDVLSATAGRAVEVEGRRAAGHDATGSAMWAG